jgi:pyruvate formate lyase activating enzyme
VIAEKVAPVERSHLSHFLPGSWSWSTGLPGCNFNCPGCLNHELIRAGSDGSGVHFTEPETVVQNAIRAGCTSISFTFTEPTIFAEYALAVMKIARKAGLKTIWMSNGYMSANCLDAVEPWLDAVTIELKSIDDAFYRRVCGAGIVPVLQNLRRLAKSSTHLEVSTLIISGQSDDRAMLSRLAQYIAVELGCNTPWHIIRFRPERSLRMKKTPGSSVTALDSALDVGKEAGLSYIYKGPEHNDTICPHCGATIVERRRFNRWRNVIRFDVNGRCPSCMAPATIKE